MSAPAVYINGRFYGQSTSGQQRYGREVVRQIDALLGKQGSRARWILLTPPGAETVALENIEQRTVGGLSSHGWDQVSFYLAARGGVALGLNGSGPLLHGRQVVVIHDAAVYRHPEHFSGTYGRMHRTIGRLLSRRATIGTVSRFSQAELADVLGIPASGIVLAPNGGDHLDLSGDADIVSRLGLADKPFFVTIGNLTRNKNVAVAVRALGLLPEGSAKLVAVGKLDEKLFGDAGLPVSGDMILPGRLSDAEIVGLMQQARALIFPSLYEGFGIPPLEAMANGCPVLASAIPAVQETCEGAAAYFEPHDEAALSQLMQRAVADEAWRAGMASVGRDRVALFRWSAPARALIAACEKLLP
jgi:Glycosyltransferase